MSRGWAALAFLVVACRAEVAVGPCSFSNAERVVTIGNRVLDIDLPVAREHAAPADVLLLGRQRLNLTTGALSESSIPYDATGQSFWAGSILAPAHPLVQHGVVRTVYDGRKFTRKRATVWEGKFRTVEQELFTGTRRVMFGKRPLVEQSLTNYPDQSLGGVSIERDGDRILCLCSDRRGTNLGIFSRAKLMRLEPGAAGIESLASYDGEVSDRGEDENSDGFFETIVVTPRIRVTKPGRYRVNVRLRNEKQQQFMGLAQANLTGTVLVPVRFDVKHLTEAIGDASPYEIFAVEVSRDSARGSMLLDQRHDVGRTREYNLSELPQGFVTATGEGSVETIDADRDGRFERLRITVALEFARAGEHALSATLRDDARRGVDAVGIVQQKMTPGRHAMTLEFSGTKIAQAGLSGPYTLKLTIYGPATPAEIEKAFVTRAFLAGDFE